MERGIAVVLPREAHGTFPIPAEGVNGVAVPAAEVARVAEWSLGDSLVAVDTSDDVVFSAAKHDRS
jgi:streptothricin hydrolase